MGRKQIRPILHVTWTPNSSPSEDERANLGPVPVPAQQTAEVSHVRPTASFARAEERGRIAEKRKSSDVGPQIGCFDGANAGGGLLSATWQENGNGCGPSKGVSWRNARRVSLRMGKRRQQSSGRWGRGFRVFFAAAADL